MDTIKGLLFYDTIKFVTVTNWQLGLLHRVIQLVVVLYIAVYAIWFNQGYQKISPVEGVLYTKVKGVAADSNGNVYDAADVVIPSVEAQALFISTKFLATQQTAGNTCVDPDKANTCNTDADCVVGTTTSFGQVQNQCTKGQCEIKGWCPVEDETKPLVSLNGVQNWTVYMRSHVLYPTFQLTANNADQAKLGYNIFAISTILGDQLNFTQISGTGAIISVLIDWSCNLDHGAENCRPTFTFLPVGASAGFNFRDANYAPTSPLTTRVLTKYYGIRFVFQVTGTGRKADVATTVITIGSGVALVSVAALIVDYFIQFFHPHRDEYLKVKREPVHLDGIEDDKDSYIKA